MPDLEIVIGRFGEMIEIAKTALASGKDVAGFPEGWSGERPSLAPLYVIAAIFGVGVVVLAMWLPVHVTAIAALGLCIWGAVYGLRLWLWLKRNRKQIPKDERSNVVREKSRQGVNRRTQNTSRASNVKAGVVKDPRYFTLNWVFLVQFAFVLFVIGLEFTLLVAVLFFQFKGSRLFVIMLYLWIFYLLWNDSRLARYVGSPVFTLKALNILWIWFVVCQGPLSQHPNNWSHIIDPSLLYPEIDIVIGLVSYLYVAFYLAYPRNVAAELKHFKSKLSPTALITDFTLLVGSVATPIVGVAKVIAVVAMYAAAFYGMIIGFVMTLRYFE